MQETTLVELGTLFLALGDKTRLRLLILMAGGPVSVGFLAESLGVSQPKVSRHLAYLRNAGVVSTRRDGKWVYYGIETPSDAILDRILSVVIASISADHVYAAAANLPETRSVGDEPSEGQGERYVNTYVTDVYDADEYDRAADTGYEAQELDVFLL